MATIAPNRDGKPAILAIEILDITTGSNQQHGLPGLPPTTFARIIAWSHGQLSAETSLSSERGKAIPALLPIGTANIDGVGRNGDAPIELEVSLWEKLQKEGTGGFSRVLLDVGADVTLPALDKLGKSKDQATEKTFPLEAHSCHVGSITLRAWIAPLEPTLDPDSGGLFFVNSPGPESGSKYGTDGDDSLSFELSESSAGEPRASIVSADNNVRKGKCIGQPDVLSSCGGVHHVAGEDHAEAESQPLDVAAAMLPLIPSFPPGTAEIRFWVHSLILPTSASPPYARFSLNPGAHGIARTSLALRGSSKQGPSWAGGDLPSGLSPGPRFVEYLLDGNSGGANATHVVSLTLGPAEAYTVRGATGEPSPPSVRVEIIAGRSLGRCDLALPEAFRRIGGVFRHLSVPIWGRGRVGRCEGHCNGSSRRTEITKTSDLVPREEQMLAGVVILDLAVVLSGEPSPSPLGMGSSLPRLSAGDITIEATGVRLRGVECENAGLGARPQEDVVGVGASLTLGGGRTKVARLNSRGCERSEAEDRHRGSPVAAAKEQDEDEAEEEEEPSRPDGIISLRSTCTEFDILSLRLIRREEGEEEPRGRSNLGLGRKDRLQGGWGGDAVRIAVSDINELFDGRPRWVPMEHDSFDVKSDGPKRNQSTSVPRRGTRKAGRQLEVKLLVSLAAPGSVYHAETGRHTSMEGRSPIQGLVPPREPGLLTDPRTLQESRAGQDGEESRPDLGFPCSALEAWITSPRNGCTQALATVPSPDDGTGVATVRHRSSRRTAPKSIETGGNCPGQAGPGVFHLDILAIHGRGHRSRVAGAREDSATQTSPAWWVRATFSTGGREPVSSVDSRAGAMSFLHENELGQNELIPATPFQRHEAGRCGLDWVVCWPRSDGVLARYPVHWTLSQSELPVVSFEVFRGQTVIARSVLELPPIIAHREGPLTFFLPCLSVVVPTTKTSEDRVFLDLRCSFEVSSAVVCCESERQRHEVGNALAGAQKEPIPGVVPQRPQGGVLCIEVVGIRRLHREVRSALASPYSAVLSLPEPGYFTGPSAAGCGSHSESRNLNRAGDLAAVSAGCHQDTEKGQKRWGGGEGGMAALRVEPRQHGNLMVLVALFGGGGRGYGTQARGSTPLDRRDGYNSVENQSLLASAWLPISDGVLERGHLEEGWHPLRFIQRGLGGTSKACDILLRMHFIPGVEHQVATSGSSRRQDTEYDKAESLTIVLEEGRHLTHPDMPTGPLELFAETYLDFELRPGCHEEASRRAGKSGYERADGSTLRSKTVVGPLPVRENAGGEGYSAAAARRGKGSSPCWQRSVHIPLPATVASADSAWWRGKNIDGPIVLPGAAGEIREDSTPPKVLLSVIIKSAARRVVTRYQSPVPRSLLANCRTSQAQPEERVAERCLTIGTARIRLPKYMFQRDGDQSGIGPMGGWYAVKDEVSGVHRGKVRLSIFPTQSSARVSRERRVSREHRDERGHGEVTSNSGDAKTCGRCHLQGPCGGNSSQGHRWGRPSSPPQTPNLPGPESRSSMPRSTPARGALACIHGNECGSSKRSLETDVAAALRRAGRGGGSERLRGCGLLFVSFDEPAMHSFGEEEKRGPPAAGSGAALVGATVSLGSHHRRSLRDDGHPPPHEGFRTAICCTKPSPFSDVDIDGDDRGFGAVLAVDQFDESQECPVLWLQVCVKTPHRPVGAAYHGILSLASCLSRAGVVAQEKKRLVRVEKRTQAPEKQGYSGHGKDRGSTEAPLTSSGADEGSVDAKAEAWARGKLGKKKAGGCCSVNVTAAFIPHTRGVLSVYPSRLRISPPRPGDLEHWRDLTELRELTRSEAAGSKGSRAHAAPSWDTPGTATSTTAFLRWRVLPAGPWEFSRTFPLRFPRPADWGRDPVGAGTTPFPGGSRVDLEMDTAIHTIAREKIPIPPGGAADSRQGDLRVAVEPLKLEACLFDNGELFSPSSVAPASSLIGAGTLILTPIMFAAGTPAKASSGDREVVLYEPGSGRSIASVDLGVTFSSHHGSRNEQIAEQPSDLSRRRPKISDISAAIWALKNIFYDLDQENAGFVRMKDILSALSSASWPRDAAVSASAVFDRMTVDLLRNLGARLADGGSGDGGGDGGGSGVEDGVPCLVNCIQYLLNPGGPKNDDDLVPWAVWAALSEVFVCANGSQNGTWHTCAGPVVTSASVWQRAEEIRSSATPDAIDTFSSGDNVRFGPSSTDPRNEAPHARFSDSRSNNFDKLRRGVVDVFATGESAPPTDQHHHESGRHPSRVVGSSSTGDLGKWPAVGLGGQSSVWAGYGDHSYAVDEPDSMEGHHRRGASTFSVSRSSRGPSHLRTSASLTALRGRPSSAPQAANASNRRLRQTLATSRRNWLPKSRHDPCPRRRGQSPPTYTGNGEKRPSAGSPPPRGTAASPATKQPDNQGRPPDPHLVLGPQGVEQPIVVLERRPFTAPAAPEAGRSESRGICTSTLSTPLITCIGPVPATAATHPLCGGLVTPSQWTSPVLGRQKWAGAWDSAPTAAEGWCKLGRKGETIAGSEEAAHEFSPWELDNGRFRVETESAKRKASRYQACMLEAQMALDKEQQRVRALEARALEAEGLLLQRDRARIRQAARARARFLQLEIDLARRNDNAASKHARVTMEETASAKIQWIAKGFLQRCRFKAELLSIRALQRSMRRTLEAGRRNEHRVRRSLAALLLQRVWRGRSTRSWLAVRRLRVIIVQAIARGHLQRARVSDQLQSYLRHRVEAAVPIQSSRRRFVARRSYLALRLGTVKVQSSHRRWRARRELVQRRLAVSMLQEAARKYVFVRFRERAANLIQKAYRLAVRTRSCRRERNAILSAAGMLQQAARAWGARRVACRKRQERRRKEAAMALQRAIRACLKRRTEHRLRVAAALTLWRITGGLSAQLSRMRKRREASAATRIQSIFRARRSRIRVAALRATRRGIAAASRIQAVTRGHRSRSKTKALIAKRREEHVASTKIQAFSRGNITRARARALRSRRRERAAATVIQALFRGYRSRVELRSLQVKRRACAVKIQGLCLRRRMKRRRRDMCERERRSASILQQAWRKSTARGIEKQVRGPSPATPASCSEPKRALERVNPALAVEAVANGMSRRGVIAVTHARQLKEVVSLRRDDPALEAAVQQKLTSLEMGMRGNTRFTQKDLPMKGQGRTSVEEALRRALGTLEQSLLTTLV